MNLMMERTRQNTRSQRALCRVIYSGTFTVASYLKALFTLGIIHHWYVQKMEIIFGDLMTTASSICEREAHWMHWKIIVLDFHTESYTSERAENKPRLFKIIMVFNCISILVHKMKSHVSVKHYGIKQAFFFTKK